MKNMQNEHPNESLKSDLFKLSKSPTEVDLAPNTIRSLFAKGLPHYRLGKLVLVSRSELEAFIKSGKAE